MLFFECDTGPNFNPAKKVRALEARQGLRLPILVLAVCLICSPVRGESSAPSAGASLQVGPAPSAPGTIPPEPGITDRDASPPVPPAEPNAPAGPTPRAEPATPDKPGSSLNKAVIGVSQKVTALGREADETHSLLELGILKQVIYLDDFFGKANSDKELHTSYLLRWRNSLRLQQGSGLNFGSTLRANIELSKINERLKLSISGEDKSDQFAPSLPEDPGNPGFDRTFRSARIVNTELRYQLIRSPATDFFLGAGVDLVLPPQVFARARFQQTAQLSQVSLLRFAETFFAKTPYGVGETTELSLERSLNPKTVLRWASSATLSQEIGALEWGSELSLLHELSSRSAVTLIGGIYGNTSFDDWVNNYRILLRYRRNFLRSWLFYELEPQVTWPRSSDGNFPVNYAFTVRLEIVFQGEERHAAGRP